MSLAEARHPHRIRLVKLTRVALAAQAAASIAAILLVLPDFVDRMLRSCAGCLDFRGLAFGLSALVLVPAAAMLMTAAWLLRSTRTWPAYLALVVDVSILGLAAYTLGVDISGKWAVYAGGPSAAVQLLQTLLVAVPAVVSLVLSVRTLKA